MLTLQQKLEFCMKFNLLEKKFFETNSCKEFYKNSPKDS